MYGSRTLSNGTGSTSYSDTTPNANEPRKIEAWDFALSSPTSTPKSEDAGSQTPRPSRPDLNRSNTSTRTMIRLASQSVPPSAFDSRRPSNKSITGVKGEDKTVNADDLFEREEEREGRIQSDDFHKEFYINWHARDPNLMATTSIDGSVKGWDLRVGDNDRAVIRLADWGDAGTQVKWNRQHDYMIASAHGNRLCIWDTRKGAVPITSVKAHDSRIYGIDWDRRKRHKIVTCSLDKTIKFWTIDDLDQGLYKDNQYFPSVPAPSRASTVIETNNPVWRARHLPFGDGVLALPQRGPSALQMWGRDGKEPLETFDGYDAPVKEFVWRSRGGIDPQFEDREFQLITWSKDRKFRMIPVATEVLERAGYRRGAPIDVLVSRRNAPDISYANWDGDSMSPVTPLAPTPTSEAFTPTRAKSGFFADMKYTDRDKLRAMSLRHKVEAVLPLPAPVTSKHKAKGGDPQPVEAKKAVMTRGVVGGKRRKRKGIDQMDWIGGVSTIRREKAGKESSDNSTDNSCRASFMGTASNTTSVSRARSMDRAFHHPIALSRLSDRRESYVAEPDDDQIGLSDEIKEVRIAYPRVKFESASTENTSMQLDSAN
ncbi:hypothetical protein QFC22_004123 [Naganishia vaughanmartiniae]|uniref:Uncharacterized protein n=1 Tax=Naganishia vaughanmartiniae TaxID=1424756 RepID=A0ACC2X636_9TREE|nr:hypothetical protein QFC22_004123 [Naganishia vaughanmartiniae]